MSKRNEMPIGIFESRVGGLTVYRALHEKLPNERFIYLGDTARVPYGTKSLATVERYAIENSTFLATLGVKMLVVACNTASALALPRIREEVGLDVVGVIGPGARRAVRETADLEKPRIGVIATEATVATGAYAKAIELASSTAKIKQAACPLFVPLAEEGWTAEDETFSIARKYLRPLVEFRPDVMVLGCTHYPLLREVIQQTVGENVKLIDSGAAAADEVAELLKEREMGSAAGPEGRREICDDLDHFYVT